jgi:hypothetical protein
MCGSMEYGKCEVCGKEGTLVRTYFEYPIKCECHWPQHFVLVRHHRDCIPKEPSYTLVSLKTETLKNPLALAVNVLINEMVKDKTEGSYYYAWQSNIACIIMDNSDIDHDKANEIAKKFLDSLIINRR